MGRKQQNITFRVTDEEFKMIKEKGNEIKSNYDRFYSQVLPGKSNKEIWVIIYRVQNEKEINFLWELS